MYSGEGSKAFPITPLAVLASRRTSTRKAAPQSPHLPRSTNVYCARTRVRAHLYSALLLVECVDCFLARRQ